MNGWFKEAIAHIELQPYDKIYWDYKENVIASTKKYVSLSFWKSDISAHCIKSAKKNNWYDECVEILNKREVEYIEKRDRETRSVFQHINDSTNLIRCIVNEPKLKSELGYLCSIAKESGLDDAADYIEKLLETSKLFL